MSLKVVISANEELKQKNWDKLLHELTRLKRINGIPKHS